MKNKTYMTVLVMAALMLFISGCGLIIRQSPVVDPGPITPVPVTPADSAGVDLEEREITLYFADAQAMYVLPEQRLVQVSKDISENDFYRNVLEELIKGPKTENLFKTIPNEVRILSVERDGDVLFIDFSDEMHTKHWRGAAGEDMTITSLANTLTELEGINRIMPTVNGGIMNIEHMVIEEPLSRMEDRIIRQ